ncbi:hypothetical protein SLEP1_g34787 [Rubroshorea leprosula]|uniref:Uncharacterized protein n=1 Tax=Rubroshorea leprosula TaxID=152421 RepID=A0AAV5KL47_9ROSI|nr:hypothetical protein SLEP1_g34787 [Rubroshorea leprosula]
MQFVRVSQGILQMQALWNSEQQFVTSFKRRMGSHIHLIRLWSVMVPSRVSFKQSWQCVPQEMRL